MKLYGLLILILAVLGCTTPSSKYKDTNSLERPPEAVEESTVSQEDGQSELEPQARPGRKGLGSDVYKAEGSSREIRIKRGYDEAWSLLGRAILMKELKVPDQDRSKGNYYVHYDGGSIFGSYSLFSSEADSTYLLKVQDEGSETKVTVSFANKEEQTDDSGLKDGFSEAPDDLSERLLDLIYETLKEDVKVDPSF